MPSQKLYLTIHEQSYLVEQISATASLANSQHYQLTCHCHLNEDLTAYLAVAAILALGGREANKQIVAGIVTQITRLDPLCVEEQPYFPVQFTVESRLALLRLQQGLRVWSELTVVEIIEKVLREHGFQKNQYQFRLFSQRQLRDTQLQEQNETDYEFLQRLLTQAGIFFFSRCQTGEEILYFLDTTYACQRAENKVLVYSAVTGLQPQILTYTQLIECKMEIDSTGQYQLFVTMHASDLQPGAIVFCDLKQFNSQYSDYYLVRAVTWCSMHLLEVVLQLLSADYQEAEPPLPIQPCLHQARILSRDKKSELDALGRYRIMYFFSRAEEEILIQVPAVSPYAQANAAGLHFPLLPETEVLVGRLESQANQPFILGGLTNYYQPSVVTAINEKLNRWVFPDGNEITMDDAKQEVSLQVANKAQSLTLSHAADVGIQLRAKQGAMLWQAESDLQLQSSGALTTVYAGDYQQVMQENYLLKTVRNSVLYTVAGNINLVAQYKAKFNAQKNLTLQVKKNCYFNAARKFIAQLAGQQAHIQLEQGACVVQTAESVFVTADASIELQVANGVQGVRLRQGKVEILADHISVNAEQKIDINATVFVDDTYKDS